MELTIFRDFPFGKVSIEQLNSFAPLRFSLSFQLRATNPRPLQLISVCICFPSFQLPVLVAKLSIAFIQCRPLWRNSKPVGSVLFGIHYFGNRPRTACHTNRAPNYSLVP